MVHGKIKEQSSKYNLLRYLQDHLNYIQKNKQVKCQSLIPFLLFPSYMKGWLWPAPHSQSKSEKKIHQICERHNSSTKSVFINKYIDVR